MQRRRVCEKCTGVKKSSIEVVIPPINRIPLMSERSLRKGYFITNGYSITIMFFTHAINVTEYASKEKNNVDGIAVVRAARQSKRFGIELRSVGHKSKEKCDDCLFALLSRR